MHKTTKGALAAAAAVALLTGGAGTLAFWSDQETVDNADIETGHLALVVDGTNTGCGGWTLDAGEAVATTYADGDPLVPGDVLTKVCEYTIDAEGNHLRATAVLSTPDLDEGVGSLGTYATFESDLDFVITDITVGGAATNVLTEEDDAEALVATITATFDPASTNVTQDVVALLNDMTLTATQDHG